MPRSICYHAIIESELASEPYFDGLLAGYFPTLAASRFKNELKRHGLAREIIATELANRTVNLAGPLFPLRMRELSNAPLCREARAFALADGVFDLSRLKARICALDLKVPAEMQNAMIADIAELLRRLGLWFIVQSPEGAMADIVKTYRAGLAELRGRFSTFVSPLEAEAVESRIVGFEKAGVPHDIAEDVAVLPVLNAVPEIILLSQAQHVPAESAARVYFDTGALLGFTGCGRSPTGLWHPIIGIGSLCGASWTISTRHSACSLAMRWPIGRKPARTRSRAGPSGAMRK